MRGISASRSTEASCYLTCPSFPIDGASLPSDVHTGFTRVVKLFKLLDSDFISYWLGRQDGRPVSVEWVTSKCQDFYRDETEAEEDEAHLTLAQQADLVITRHWLTTLLWRIAISHGVMLHLAPEALPLLFPANISRRVRHSMEAIPERDIELHGVGIVQKLFELTDTMADVILHFPPADLEGLTEQLDDLDYLGQRVITSARLDDVRKGILKEKFRRLQATRSD